MTTHPPSEEMIEATAKMLAATKLRLQDVKIAPEIGKKTSSWSPGLLRAISEVEVRAGEASMLVRIDEETGEAIGWRYSARPIASHTVNLTEEGALEIAKAEVDIPSDAELSKVELLNRGGPGSTYSVQWIHVVAGIPVEEDFLVVKINPETKEVISVSKNWSAIGND